MLLSIRAETISLKAHTRLFPQHKGLALWREQVHEKCLLDTFCFWASLLGEGWCSTCQKGHVWNCKNSSRVCIVAQRQSSGCGEDAWGSGFDTALAWKIHFT